MDSTVTLTIQKMLIEAAFVTTLTIPTIHFLKSFLTIPKRYQPLTTTGVAILWALIIIVGYPLYLKVVVGFVFGLISSGFYDQKALVKK